MLTLEDLNVSYQGKTVLNRLHFQFEEEKIYGVIGKSGSGKSTLLKAIAAVLPFEGRILLNREPLDVRRHRIALVPQKNSLVKWHTIRKNIALPLAVRHLYEEDRFQALCREVGIESILDSYPNHISGGEQQRAAICRAFLFKPDVLLLDEAFSALDAITKDDVHQAFLATIRRHKVTTLLISHDMDEALLLAEQILILKDGGFVAALENPLFGLGREENEEQRRDMRREMRGFL